MSSEKKFKSPVLDTDEQLRTFVERTVSFCSLHPK
jgi:hypothetical protein